MLEQNQKSESNFISYSVNQRVKLCSSCHGINLQLRAIRKNNKRCYYCKNCCKTRKPVEVTKNGERMIVVCPCCDGYIIRKGFSINHKQKYYCPRCDKSTLSPKICREHPEKIKKLGCVNCQSTELRKRGFDRFHRQRYWCVSCNYRSIRTISVFFDLLIKEPIVQNPELELNGS